MQEGLFKVTNDVGELKTWRIALEAVEAYKRSERKPEATKSDSKVNADLVKNVGIALAIILALITAMFSGKGIL